MLCSLTSRAAAVKRKSKRSHCTHTRSIAIERDGFQSQHTGSRSSVKKTARRAPRTRTQEFPFVPHSSAKVQTRACHSRAKSLSRCLTLNFRPQMNRTRRKFFARRETEVTGRRARFTAADRREFARRLVRGPAGKVDSPAVPNSDSQPVTMENGLIHTCG